MDKTGRRSEVRLAFCQFGDPSNRLSIVIAIVICSLNLPFSGSAHGSELLKYLIQVSRIDCERQLEVFRFPKAPLK